MELEGGDSDSDDSFVSSDGGLSDDDDWSQPASAARIMDAYHSQVDLPTTFPDGMNFGRKFLRKNETAYANRPSGTNVLPGYAPNPNCYDASEKFGLLRDDDREIVGTLNDGQGNPVARIVESKPPPANANYSHMKDALAYKLNRAQGVDPDAQAKTEVQAIRNGDDNVYGEASIAADRITEAIAVQSRSIFFNRKHAQNFAEQDVVRDDMYDGYNLKHPNCSRAPPLEHSWRNVLNAPQAPQLPQSAVARRAVHGDVAGRREELSGVYRRPPQMHTAVEQINTDTIPVHTTHTGRGDARAESSKLAARIGSGNVSATDTKPRAAERAPREGEVHGTTLAGGAQTSATAARATVLLNPNERQKQQPTPSATSHIDGHRVKEALTREGSDDRRVHDTPKEVAGAAPHVSGNTVRTTAHNVQREGGDDYKVQRVKDAGASHTSARRAMPVEGARDLSDDDIRVHELLYAQSAVQATAVQAKHAVGGTDASSVHDERAGSHLAGQKARPRQDAPLPERAELKPNRQGQSASDVQARRVVAIGEDRVPTCEAATWHGGLSTGLASGSSGRKVDGGTDQLHTTRSNEAQPASGADARVQAASHRATTETRATAGSEFLPDRLAQPNELVRERVEHRVDAEQVSRSNRSTPISALYGSDAGANDRPSLGELRCDGRETPLRWRAIDAGQVA